LAYWWVIWWQFGFTFELITLIASTDLQIVVAKGNVLISPSTLYNILWCLVTFIFKKTIAIDLALLYYNLNLYVFLDTCLFKVFVVQRKSQLPIHVSSLNMEMFLITSSLIHIIFFKLCHGFNKVEFRGESTIKYTLYDPRKKRE
jgi:hypothetical protein